MLSEIFSENASFWLATLVSPHLQQKQFGLSKMFAPSHGGLYDGGVMSLWILLSQFRICFGLRYGGRLKGPAELAEFDRLESRIFL